MDTRNRPPAPDRAEPTLRLGELTDAAGVSVRTVRYYIAEGLLPPPVGAGPHAAYTPAHLERLRLIGLMKDAYFPLREIRRRLVGLDDGAVRAALAEWARTGDASFHGIRDDAPAVPAALRDSAADYVARLQAGPVSAPSPVAPASAPEPRAARYPQPPARAAPAAPEPATWRRVPLSEEAELLIREDAYHRHQDRVEWLVEWARKVFG